MDVNHDENQRPSGLGQNLHVRVMLAVLAASFIGGLVLTLMADHRSSNTATPVPARAVRGFGTYHGTMNSPLLQGSAIDGNAAAGKYYSLPDSFSRHSRAPVVGNGSGNGSGLPSQIIHTCQLTVRVGKDKAELAAGTAMKVIVNTFGGYVSGESQTGKHGNVELTVRVPAGRFYTAVHALQAMGVVTSESIHGQDVSLQFVDLGSRLKNLEAQRARLLALYNRAQNVNAIIHVQNVLSGVQANIEQTKGRILYLADRSNYSSISVYFQSKHPKKVKKIIHPAKPTRFGQAWGDALGASVNVMAGALVVVGYALPLTFLGLLLYLGFLLFRWVIQKPNRVV